MDLSVRLAKFLGAHPPIPASAYISPHAFIAGDVRLGERVSVWPMAVLRADIDFIEIGDDTNLQDGVIVHLADDLPVRVGKRCTVGHRATLHACTIGDECLIGMGATVLDGAVVGAGSIVGAHALVTKGQIIPPGSMVLGMPAKVARPLTKEEQIGVVSWAEKYVVKAAAHRAREAALGK